MSLPDAFWAATLTDAEVASLAAGYSPLFIRRDALKAYWSLVRREAVGSDQWRDWMNHYHFNEVNGSATGVHPPGIIDPEGIIMGVPITTVGNLTLNVSNGLSIGTGLD